MGCDIHIVLEEKTNGAWVGVHAFPYLGKSVYCENAGYKGWRATQRDYGLFAELANVRGVSNTEVVQRGIPADASALTKLRYSEWSGDAHGMSWATLEEFVAAYMRAYPQDSVEAKVFETYKDETLEHAMIRAFFAVDPPDATYRVVFWFDN